MLLVKTNLTVNFNSSTKCQALLDIAAVSLAVLVINVCLAAVEIRRSVIIPFQKHFR